MERRHPLESIRLVIRNVLPNVTVESISALPSRRLLRFFNVKVSDGRTLLLSLPPPPTLRLLRSERALSLSETAVTKWILETALEYPSQVGGPAHESVDTHHHIESQSRRDEQITSFPGTQEPRKDILRYLPILVAHLPSSAELGSPCNIFEATRGGSIAELATPLTISEKQIVDFQRGQFVRQLSGFTSPNGLFGPAIAVIGPQSSSTDLQPRGSQQANVGFRGARSWRQTFHSLLEGVLRDAEDMAVTISYEPIRGYFNRLSHVLDGVTVARLVILDASDESNVLVSRSTKPAEKSDEKHPPIPTPHPEQGEIDVPPEKSDESRHRTEGDKAGGGPSDTQPSTINVTGLRDWSNCIFGDPLMTEAFSRGPTAEFLRGFDQPQGANASATSTVSPSSATNLPTEESSNEIPHDIVLIEDRSSAATRLLLYECYHATIDVVKSFYRPGPSSSDREIAARRRLATVLRKLEEADEETANKRARRPSANVEAWPVKKAKGDSPLPSIESPGETAGEAGRDDKETGERRGVI
ncbi:autophagy protein atg9 [Hypoxylon texense]